MIGSSSSSSVRTAKLRSSRPCLGADSFEVVPSPVSSTDAASKHYGWVRKVSWTHPFVSTNAKLTYIITGKYNSIEQQTGCVGEMAVAACASGCLNTLLLVPFLLEQTVDPFRARMDLQAIWIGLGNTIIRCAPDLEYPTCIGADVVCSSRCIERARFVIVSGKNVVVVSLFMGNCVSVTVVGCMERVMVAISTVAKRYPVVFKDKKSWASSVLHRVRAVKGKPRVEERVVGSRKSGTQFTEVKSVKPHHGHTLGNSRWGVKSSNQ